jgi:hypothetical protein
VIGFTPWHRSSANTVDAIQHNKAVMAHHFTPAAWLCGGFLLAMSQAVPAAMKVDEGFASQYDRNGRHSRPTDRITEGTLGKDAYYWIQWRDHPVGRSTFRCRVTHEATASPIVDEEITYAESTSEGFSLCGFTPRKGHSPEGKYTFTQYLDGAKVGEAALMIESHAFADLRLFPWKLALIVFAVAVLVLAWVSRKNPRLA